MKNIDKKSKIKSLSKKITFRILTILCVIFFIFLAIRMIATKEDLEKRELEKLTMLAGENAVIAKNLMESMVDKQDALISSITSLVGNDEKIMVIEDMLRKTKSEEDNILSLFFVAEPNQIVSGFPDGFTIVSTAGSTKIDTNRFTSINQAIYDRVKNSDSLIIADPYKQVIDGKEYMAISVINPIFDQNGQLLGIIGSSIDTKVLNDATYSTGNYESFSNQIICGHQTIIVHTSNPDWTGKKFQDITDSKNPQKILDSAQNAAPLTFLDTNTDGSQEYRAFVPFYVADSKVVWLSGTSIQAGEFNKSIITEILVLFVTMMLGLILMAILFFVVIHRALRPMAELEHAAREMADGNLKIRITHHSDDELGSLAESLRCSASTISAYVTDIDRAMSCMEKGDFDLYPTQPFVGDFKHIENSITNFIFGISHTLQQINQTTNIVSSESEQVAKSAQDLSEGTVKQERSIDQLSSNIEHIRTHIHKNSLNASVASEKVNKVGEEIEEGHRRMKELVSAIDVIGSTSKEISRIVKVIDDIALQTNLLALNASVEAARAGTYGKGFAVVAGEVRNLAGKSSQAVKETTALIENAYKAVENGKQLAEETSHTIDVVTAGSRDIVLLIDEISKATSQQSKSMEEVSLGVSQISSVVQANTISSQESAATSEELFGQAHMLKNLISRFKLKTGPAPTSAK